MKITDEGLELIKRFEGLALEAYQDIAGVWTIGYGRTAGVAPGQRITEAEAEDLLRQDVAGFEDGVERAVTVELNPNEFSALVSFSFNVGLGALRRSTALQRLNAGDRLGAADALLWWNKATVGGEKVVVRGLARRRAAERALFLKPYPDAAFLPAQASLEENSRLEAVEAPPRREKLAESRTIQGAAGAGATGLGAVAMGQHQAREAEKARDAMANDAPGRDETPPEAHALPPGEEPVIVDGMMAETADDGGPMLTREEVFQDIYMQLFAGAGILLAACVVYVILARIDDWLKGRR